MSSKPDLNDAVLAAADYLKAWGKLNGFDFPRLLLKRLEAVKARHKYLPDPHVHVKLQAEEHLAAAMTKYLAGMQERLTAWAEKRKGSKDIPLTFWEEENKILEAILGPQLQRMAYTGMSIAAEKAGIAFETSMANQAAADWAAKQTDILLQQLGTTTQDGIGSIIEDWISTDGATMGDLVQSLLDTGLMGPDRASMIAVTETTRAFAQGEISQYQAAGIQQMRWQTNNDEIVCDICEPLNQEIRGIGEEFDAGITDPPAHVNCRCWLTPVVGEKSVKVMSEGIDSSGGFFVPLTKLASTIDLKKPYLRIYAQCGDLTAWLVDGRYIRDNIWLDFTEGGNDEVYGGADPDKPSFIPKGEIWIDNNNLAEAPYILLHELTERNNMQDGEDYDQAHEAANTAEQKARDDPDKLMKLLAGAGWTQ